MAGKRVLTARLKANMIASDDVYTTDDRLLFTEGTVLTEETIEALKDHSVFAIRIKVGEDGKTPLMGEPPAEGEPEITDESEVAYSPAEPDYSSLENADDDRYYEKLRNSSDYKAFHATFINTIEKMKGVFNRVVMQNEKIDSDNILADVEEVVSESRNSLHILDMLQCMKGYDDVTYVHSLNVALLSNMIGKIVFPKMPKEDLDVLTLSGLLHDIGKMMIPDDVLQKKGHLTISEFNVIKTHVLHGHNILQAMDLDPRIAEVAMRHHERCDGSGYPGGYHDNQISSFAKIVAIADTYDAMTSDRVYRKAICPFDVIHMFEREGLVKYEVEYLLPFLETAVQAYMNIDVHLTTDEIGKVVMVNANELSKPVVKVGTVYYDLTKERSISIDRIID